MSSARAMLGFLILLAAACVGLGGEAEGGARRRVLYFSQAVGNRHETIPLGRQVIARLGAMSGRFDLDECTDCRKWSADYFAPYDAIVLFGSGRLPLSEANKKALIEFVRGGKGFVGIHCAIQVYARRRWREYPEMLGAVLLNTLCQREVRITVEDRFHPATRHFGLTFKLNEEFYQFARWSRDKTHVLLSIDIRSVDFFRDPVRRKDQDFAVSWCHPYGKGRVFYTSLGHSAHVWRDLRFQKHLVNGIRWAMGDAEANVRLGTDGRIHEVTAPREPGDRAMLNLRVVRQTSALRE